MGESILVTGGAGFIGSHLVDALVERGHQVRVYDNLEPQVHGPLRELGRWPDHCNPGAEYILGDIRDREALRKALHGINVIFHQASMVGVGQSMYEIERYVDANIRGTADLMDILANDTEVRDQVCKVVLASSMSIYGEGKYECPVHGVVYPQLRSNEQLTARDWELHCPVRDATQARSIPQCNQLLKPLPADEDKPLYATSIYAISKKAQEEMCLITGHAYNIPTVALRYFNVYGPRQALSNPYTGVAAIFSSRLLNGKPPVIFEDGLQRRDFVHVSDIVQANLLAMEKAEMDYGSFNVGTGRSLTILDVANTLCKHLNGKLVPEIVQKFRAGDIRHCYPDINRLQEFGYAARFRFEDGVSELINWVRRQTVEDSFEYARDELVKRGLAV